MPQQGLEQRAAEGSRTGPVGRGKSAEVAEARKGGRPKGSKNRSKSLIPTELADKILVTMEGNLPSEHLDYMRDVVKRGGAVATKRELDILILLLNRNLWPALVSEPNTKNDDGEPVFRKDVTERLKVLNSLLSLRNQIEKGEEKANDDGNQPLLQIFGSRDIASRIGVLIQNPERNEGRAVSAEPLRVGPGVSRTEEVSPQADLETEIRTKGSPDNGVED